MDSTGIVTVDEPSRAENGAGRDTSPGAVTHSTGMCRLGKIMGRSKGDGAL